MKKTPRLHRPYLSPENGKKKFRWVNAYPAICLHLRALTHCDLRRYCVLTFSQEFYCNQTILSAYGSCMRSRRNMNLNFENRLNFSRFRCRHRSFFNLAVRAEKFTHQYFNRLLELSTVFFDNGKLLSEFDGCRFELLRWQATRQVSGYIRRTKKIALMPCDMVFTSASTTITPR